MNAVKQYGGVALIGIGALLLLFNALTWVTGNAVLLTGLFFIIAGVIMHVFLQKRRGKY